MVPQVPQDGGIMLKMGSATGKPKVREFHFEHQSKSTIVYKSQKIWGNSGSVELSTFFVCKVRNATEEEIKLVLGYANLTSAIKISAKRCFDVDFYDPEFPLAIGPAKNRSVTIFAVPDQTLADLWGYFVDLMVEEGIFQPSSEDPNVAVIVGVPKRGETSRVVEGRLNRHSSSESIAASDKVVIAPQIEVVAKVLVDVEQRPSKYNKANADAMLNSLPLPPATELEFIHNDDEEDED